MNKQEALKKIEKLEGLTIKDKDFNFDIEMIPNGEALKIVNQLDEPEKTVVPKFVGEWIEVCKDNLALSLANSMNPIVLRTNNQPEKTIHWFKSAKNQEKFAKAWLYGYEAEEEKLYTVEIPNPNAVGHVVLCKNSDGIVSITFARVARWQGVKNAQLTEEEIKQDFEWAWPFAIEVKE